MHENSEKWYLTRQTFPELLHRNVFRFPNRPAQLWRDKKDGIASLSYGNLGEIVRQITGGLLALGVEKGDRIAIIAPTVPQWVWADYAILCAGAITVAIHSSYTSSEMEEQLKDSGSRFVFVYGKMVLEQVLSIKNKELEGIVWMGPEDRDLPEYPYLFMLEDFRKKGESFFQKSPMLYDQCWQAVQRDDPMTLIYTSGTTGQAKGVLHTHASVTSACIRDLYVIPVLTEADCLLAFLPLSHSFERQSGHAIAMSAAVPVAYGSAQTLSEDLHLFRPTFMMGVPSIFMSIYGKEAPMGFLRRFLFAKAESVTLKALELSADSEGCLDATEGHDMLHRASWRSKVACTVLDFLVFRKLRKRFGGRLRFVFSAASILPEKICRLYLCANIRILEGYGSTETCNAVALNPIAAIKPGSVGVFSKGVEYKIAADGELLIKGDFLFSEYWQRPDETRKVFTDDGFYHTGDLVDLPANGYLRIVDRKKGILVLNTGHRVASAKIESLFALSPYIERVISVGDDRPFPLVLVEPNFKVLIRIFKKHGILFDEDSVQIEPEGGLRVSQDFLKIPELITMLELGIATVNEKLGKFEKIRNYILMPAPLSLKRGELTPTLKVRRDVVFSCYSDAIEKTYAKGPRL